MEYQRRMYVTSVSTNTVVLSPETNSHLMPGGGLGITQVTLTTNESTALAAMFGTTGSCAVMEVIVRKVQ